MCIRDRAWTFPSPEHADIALNLPCQHCNRNHCPDPRCLTGMLPDVYKRQDELIPTDAGSHISIAELFLQAGTHPPEDNIPGAVAERIVDALEIVDVHDAEEKSPFSSQNRLQPSDCLLYTSRCV